MTSSASLARAFPRFHALRPWFYSLACATALTACGGGASDPLQAYKLQTLQWNDCGSNSPLMLTAGLQCTTLRVPLDYAHPDREAIHLRVSRVPAMSGQRKGAVLFNPGGPGADGTFHGLGLLSQILSQEGSTPEMSGLQTQLLQGYDLVGFSPRGSAGDSAHVCASDTHSPIYDGATAYRLQPGNLKAIDTSVRQIAESCRQNPRTPFINTDATARDMDLLRGLLGDEKISYLGYSYGTWLGAWYASLFPAHVDRMVLDSNTDFSSPSHDITEHQPLARQQIVDEVLAPYAARHPAYFNLGATAAAVRQEMAQWHPWLKASVAPLLSNNSYSHSNTHASLLALSAAKGLQQLLNAMPQASPEVLASAIATHAFLPQNTPQANQQVRDAALELLDRYQAAKADSSSIGAPSPTPIRLEATGSGNLAALFTITCNDSTLPSADVGYWHRLGAQLAAQAPMAFDNMIATQVCHSWGGPSVQRPPLSAMQGLDIVMLQSQYDGATPTPGAMKAFAALPKARMIDVPGEYTHGVFPYNTECVDIAVLRHLLGQAPRERQTHCAASPVMYPLDALPTKAQPVDAATAQAQQQREALIREFKQAIRRGAGT